MEADIQIPEFKGWDEETDVIVIGGGLAGHCAALQAAQGGANVLLFEKESSVGGSTVLSGGSFAFAGTDLQKKNGVNDTSERLFDDLRRVGGYVNEEAIVRTYVDYQLETYYWLANQGVIFEKLFLAAGQTVPRSHSHNPSEVIKILASRASLSGHIKTRVNSPVKRLIRQYQQGQVEGVLALVSGRWCAIKAYKGTVLTSGGFSRNEHLMKLFAPSQTQTQRAGGPGNTGDGLSMAWYLGAGMRDMGYIKGTFGGYPGASPGEHAIMLPIYVGAIAVNLKGERFIDESKSYKLIGDAVLQQPESVGFQIFDQKIYDKGQPDIPTMAFQAKYALGQVISANSIGDLAKKINVDVEGLKRTVAIYNASVESGQDKLFGRDGLSTHYGALAKIDQAPFYAYPSKSVVVATYCGIAVNTSMNVCDVFGNAIPNLYAAGEVIGGLHGHAYMTGSSLGKASIFGRLAAKSALIGTSSSIL